MFHIIPLGGAGKLFLMTSILLHIVTYNHGVQLLPKGKFVSGRDQIFYVGGIPP
jgi:hypothetical protein